MANKTEKKQPKLRLKKGDYVVVISGDDKGKKGTYSQSLS